VRRCGTGAQIKSEAEVFEHCQLETDIERPGFLRRIQAVENDCKGIVQPRMGIAFRQQSQQRRHGLYAMHADRTFHQPSGTRIQQFDLVLAQMLVKPGTPDQVHRIARLKHRLQSLGTTAAHDAHVAAMRPGHHLGDNRGFTVLPEAQDDSLVSPFHRVTLPAQCGNSSPISR
jgi:hypothetical protein